MPLASAVYQRVRGQPVLAALLESVPMRVRLYDGRPQMLPFRLWRLAHIWKARPELRAESEAALAAYCGGDVVDIGAFEGWYSVLLGSKSRPGDTLLSIEPDAAAFPELQATLAAAARAFSGRTFQPVQLPAGNGHPVVPSRPPGGHPQFAAAAEGDGTSTIAVDDRPPGVHPADVEELLQRNGYTVRVLEESDVDVRQLWTARE